MFHFVGKILRYIVFVEIRYFWDIEQIVPGIGHCLIAEIVFRCRTVLAYPYLDLADTVLPPGTSGGFAFPFPYQIEQVKR